MTTRALTAIHVGTRHRRDLGDLDGLARSMDAIGLLHPIVVTPASELIAGRRRLEAARRLGWPEIPVRVIDLAEIVRGEFAENAHRKDFTPSEAVAIGLALEALEREQARERQGTRTDLPGPSGKFPEGSRGQTRDKVASAVGMSGRTYERARAIVEAARQEPDKYADLQKHMDRTGKVNGVHRRLVSRRQAEQIAQEPPPPPAGTFRVLVADPPWPYDKRPGDPTQRGACDYPPMTLEDIRALPVGAIAHADSVLWLWTTNAHLPDAFDVLRAWGFTHKTLLTWVKDRMGCGDWLRGQTEHCLLAVRGQPTVTLTNETTVIHADAREHSRKPEDFYTLVESLCPGSKVELFARCRRPGWTAHGDQVGQFPDGPAPGVKSPLKYHGGKNYLARRIVELMPRHLNYVEPFAGSLAVLLAKNPEGVAEVANDLNGDLTQFWRVLQGEDTFARFRRVVEAVPFSEVEWQDAMDGLANHPEADPVQRAVWFFIAGRQSLAGRMDTFALLSRRRVRRGMNEQASAWWTAVEGLPAVHRRLAGVSILNRPALEVIRQQDGPDTLFYLDPTYPHETRTAREVYGRFEMTEADHRELLDVIRHCHGKVILSSYPSPLYEAALADWTRHTFDLANHAAGGRSKRRMQECVWCNFGKG
jgi:DNA adenine methylase